MPILGDLYRLTFDFFIFGVKALLARVIDDLGHLSWIESVENVEEVGSINLTALGKFCWQMLFELLIIFVMFVDVFHTKFRIMRDADMIYIRNLNQLLAVCENILEEILGDVVYWWDIVLD